MQVWKFRVAFNGSGVEMPKGAHILSADIRDDSLMVWARVDPEARTVTRRIPVYGTGYMLEDFDAELPLIATVFMGPLVLHVFDGGEV